ncbi:hypothetical protein B296_00045299, partial [Ensete ventricosum]
VFTDSQLVAGQIDGSFEALELNMARYLAGARQLLGMTKYLKSLRYLVSRTPGPTP